ncbi:MULTISPECIES: DUF5691 domain-containing protein [unclassified Variovorax]|uniref:DUF5691 domain-containing protein n=1 Tax=unclassified Variovorax TaxID=663243 RepID=UPI000D12CD9F|nr:MULTISPECIES: DUF5691 domain-containing protein [unclassified Variovorax]AVQ83221.1 hypothetical protein C4F17_20875 [Variovorax sp. PMC12]QRY32478.1 hypothetical protein JVX96_04015 [Variovorax sp. PDNC026]
MSHWNQLLQAALVGTSRQPVPPAAGMAGEFAGLLQALQGGEAQGRLLRMAGAVAVGRRAGFVAPKLPPSEAPVAAEDKRPELKDATLQAAIADALSSGPLRLQHEGLAALAAAGLRLPHSLLPLALDAGRRAIDLRPAVAPALGERGLWLAARNDDWRYAVGASEQADAQTRWDEGSLDQRVAVLREQRQADPAGARERLAAELQQLPAKDRAALLGALAENLGPDDEALIDAQLKDRARDVRQAAVELLQRLPQSAHAQRIAAFLEPLLKHDGATWRIDAPEAADARWKDDAIDPARPTHEGLGERAWWLYQLVRQAPLSWWTARTGMTPAALLDWAAAGDWKDALLRGWNDAVIAAPDHDWCDAMLDRPRAQRAWIGQLLALLPRARRERHWLAELGAEGNGAQEVVGFADQACAPGETPSAELSARLAAALRLRVERGSLANDYMLRQVLTSAAALLHPSALPALADLPRTADETPGTANALAETARIVRARRLFLTLSSTSSSPSQGRP